MSMDGAGTRCVLRATGIQVVPEPGEKGVMKTARNTYRHGDLRNASIDHAMRIVREQGVDALSMRAVAQAAGVAHRSLYNHFENRDALMDSIATVALNALAQDLEKARTRDEFVEIYVTHALGERELYAVITSRPHATMKERPALQSAVHEVIAVAVRLFGEDNEPSAAVRREVMKVFILIYGAVSLHQSGILDHADDAELVRELQIMVRK